MVGFYKCMASCCAIHGQLQNLPANLLKNGNFEEGPYSIPNTTWGVIIPPNIEDTHSPLPGWMVESLKAVKYIDFPHFSVPSGKRAVELVAGKESALAQVVRTARGKAYALTFSVGDAANSCEGSMLVEAYAAKGNVKVPYESTGHGGFKRGVLRFTAVSERTRVVFLSSFYHSKTDGSLCGPVIDDVTLVSIRRPLLLGGPGRKFASLVFSKSPTHMPVECIYLPLLYTKNER